MQPRRIAADGMGLIMEDFDEIKIERSQIEVTLIVNLQDSDQNKKDYFITK